MSSKLRRANPPTVQTQAPSPTPSSTQNNRPVDMTLPQVLQLLETRIRKLEQVKPAPESTPSTTSPMESVISALQVEYDSRFDLLVTEINQMKDILMKLQSYTMDVNKTLLEERVHLMADMSVVKENIVMREMATITESEEEEEES